MIQQYLLYTATDQTVWFLLFDRQLNAVRKDAYSNFLPGLKKLRFTMQEIPRFDSVNLQLRETTGWKLYAVPGLIDNRYFFEQMLGKEFGATTWLRKIEQIDYLEEPDMFHDVFGHVPLLTDPVICNYLHELAGIAHEYNYNEQVVEYIARLYWYTIEFGLIKENGNMKIYGAGILSSIGETTYALSDKPRHENFDVKKIIDTPYIKDSYQEQYFVLRSLNDLSHAAKAFKDHLSKTVLN